MEGTPSRANMRAPALPISRPRRQVGWHRWYPERYEGSAMIQLASPWGLVLIVLALIGVATLAVIAVWGSRLRHAWRALREPRSADAVEQMRRGAAAPSPARAPGAATAPARAPRGRGARGSAAVPPSARRGLWRGAGARRVTGSSDAPPQCRPDSLAQSEAPGLPGVVGPAVDIERHLVAEGGRRASPTSDAGRGPL